MAQSVTATPIEFYFDFASPYGYFASELIEGLANRHGRAIAWHPILLGPVFKITGAQPLPSIPLKGDYARRDIERSARWFKLPFRHPSKFPLMTVPAARAYYAVAAQDPAKAVELVHALYRAYFVADRDLSQAEEVVNIAADIGVDRTVLTSALGDPAIKDKLKAEVDSSIAKGLFGSPYIIVDGEPFHGADRLDQVERWLERGGW